MLHYITDCVLLIGVIATFIRVLELNNRQKKLDSRQSATYNMMHNHINNNTVSIINNIMREVFFDFPENTTIEKAFITFIRERIKNISAHYEILKNDFKIISNNMFKSTLLADTEFFLNEEKGFPKEMVLAFKTQNEKDFEKFYKELTTSFNYVKSDDERLANLKDLLSTFVRYNLLQTKKLYEDYEHLIVNKEHRDFYKHRDNHIKISDTHRTKYFKMSSDIIFDIDNAKRIIQEGNIKDIITLLEELVFFVDDSKNNMRLILLSDLNTINRNSIMGINEDDKNKLIKRVLNFLDEIK